MSVDFFALPTIRFQILYVFLVLAHDRRRIVHFAVTPHPTAEWTAQETAVAANSPNAAGVFRGLTDSEGKYRLLDLPPVVDYKITAEHVGFSKFERPALVVSAGLDITVERREWSDALQLTPGILSASTDNYGGQVYFMRGSENENHATLLDGADIGSFKQNWPSKLHLDEAQSPKTE